MIQGWKLSNLNLMTKDIILIGIELEEKLLNN